MKRFHLTIAAFVVSIFLLTLTNTTAMAQQDQRKFRIAKIEVESAYLEPYKAALAENAKASIEQEPGVLMLQAVFDKAHPTRVTVFEVYAGEDAYQAHLKTARRCADRHRDQTSIRQRKRISRSAGIARPY